VIITEAVYTVLSGKIGLGPARFRQTQVIEPQVSRKMWLIMARKQRLGLHDVCPLREALTPPLVILRDGMELRKVDGDSASFHLTEAHSLNTISRILLSDLSPMPTCQLKSLLH
jgi:hypothetical protein